LGGRGDGDEGEEGERKGERGDERESEVDRDACDEMYQYEMY
jgi:hypothetical protein